MEQDYTVKVFDQFYNLDLVVNASEYDIVLSYFENFIGSTEKAKTFSSILFRISNITQIPVLDLLNTFQQGEAPNISRTMAYYLNSVSNKVVLFGVNNKVTPNNFVTRNIINDAIAPVVTPPPPPIPVANFIGNPLSGDSPLTVSFTDISTNSPTSWAWDFNNDGVIDSTEQNPTYIYSAPGTYSVKLTATNANGSTSKLKIGYVTVTTPPPVADFSGSPLSGNAPLIVNFTDTSTNSPTSWAWDFTNNGSIDNIVQNPTYTYSTPGTYSVRLVASNASGSDTEIKNNYITVLLPVPVADFSATPLTGSDPLSVTFTDLSTNSPTSWAWDFNNDGVIDSTEQNPTYIYSAPGTYSVKLTATNASGPDSEIKIDYINVSGVEFLWSRKQIYFGSLGTDGQVTQRSIDSLRQVDVDVVGLFENPPTNYVQNDSIVDNIYNYADDRVYILKYRGSTNEWRLLKFDPRLMVTESSVDIPINPGIFDLRLVSTSFDDIWLNERYDDGINARNRLRRFNTTTLTPTFDCIIVEFDNLMPQWQTACGTDKISVVNLTLDGLAIIQITSPTTYSYTEITLNSTSDFAPNFESFESSRCYNEITNEIWIPYSANLPGLPFVALINATTNAVNYIIDPGRQYEPIDIWWNSYTNRMIMYVGIEGYSFTGCLECMPDGVILGVHGENDVDNWINFRPSGDYITCQNNYTGYGTAEFYSAITPFDTQPVNLTVDYDDFYGSPNNYRKWDTRAGYWTYIPPRLNSYPEPMPVYTTTPPVAIPLGLISNNWNSGDIVTTTGVTWYKITYDGILTYTINILPTVTDPYLLADIIIYDSHARQIQLRNAQIISQNENAPGDYYIAVVLTDQGPANSYTVGYDIFPTPTALSSYSFQLEAVLA